MATRVTAPPMADPAPTTIIPLSTTTTNNNTTNTTDPLTRLQTAHKRLLLLSIFLLLCGILTLGSGANLYLTTNSHTSSACNFGYSGLFVILFSAFGALPFFLKSRTSMVVCAGAMSTWGVVMFVLWVALVGTLSYYDLRGAEKGYGLQADVFLGRLKDGRCYDAPNPKSTNCICIYDKKDSTNFDWTEMCTPHCSQTASGVWAVWSFLFIGFCATCVMAGVAMWNGGCVCVRDAFGAREQVHTATPVAQPATEMQ